MMTSQTERTLESRRSSPPFDCERSSFFLLLSRVGTLLLVKDSTVKGYTQLYVHV